MNNKDSMSHDGAMMGTNDDYCGKGDCGFSDSVGDVCLWARRR